MSSAYMNRARGRSLSQQPSDDELLSIERQSEFINMTFKYTINDLENVIAMLRARFTAEEAYLTSLYKVRKMAYANDGERTNLNHDARATFQTAVKVYEATVIDMINSRHRLRDTIKAEIDNLVKQKVF
ncbi:uncharacterized protein EV154DRAFT_479288 [Mucor mucedo]|uniref:uncharacterized protein n=1 Tax=Mucor mucedo TaxID=29922 RepID=UPI0022202F5F|nr:uncharacterized protein EV154DRAFT_479288 [Mucor mucedo]KAI7893536.1 hypothetical protein EV154DRAFT_479288 [Mucor mucedo]